MNKLLAGLISALGLCGQVPLERVVTAVEQSVPLGIEVVGEGARDWEFLGASLNENFYETKGLILVWNRSARTAEELRLFAEYFDQRGRICFTAVFSSAQTWEGDEATVPAGATRTLHSHSLAMGPLTRPVRVRVRILKGDADNAVIYGPPGINGDGARIEKPFAPELLSTPFTDLVLAKYKVSAERRTESFEVLKALTPEMARWAEEFFAPTRRFETGLEHFANAAGEGLVLVRLMNWSEGLGADELYRSSPWLREYADGLGDGQVLPVVDRMTFIDTRFTVPMPRPAAATRSDGPFEAYAAEYVGSIWATGVLGVERRAGANGLSEFGRV